MPYRTVGNTTIVLEGADTPRPRAPQPPVHLVSARMLDVARGELVEPGDVLVPHGRNPKELVALVERGITPLQAIRAATTVAAELIDVDDRGRLEAGLLADVIAVPGDPLSDITVTESVSFVMKGGQIHRHDRAS